MLLPNGCSCSNPSVFPKNWMTCKNTTLELKWRIQYRFRDPGQTEEFKKTNPYGKLIVIKGMNYEKDIKDRRIITQALLARELQKLESGFNPIENKTVEEMFVYSEIDMKTPLPQALTLAIEKLKVKKQTLIDIHSAVKSINLSIISLNMQNMATEDVRTKHVMRILDNCNRVKKYWSGHLYNHYRTYLMMLFKILVKHGAIDTNPVREVEKESVIQRIRPMLTKEEQILIDDHFRNSDPFYHRFLHIFFHSGARPIELLELKKEHVDLKRGCYKITVNKGGKIREEERPIKDNAMSYWESLMENVKPSMFLFGKMLRPSLTQGTRDYITKKWQREIKSTKTGLGIAKDLYSLKHLNLDETAEALSIIDAAKQAGHSSPVVTMKHYATGEKSRQNERLRSVDNKFAG